MHFVKELLLEDQAIFPSSTNSSFLSDRTLPLNVVIEVGSRSNDIDYPAKDGAMCPECTCVFLKYTKEQMERNPIQLEDEYGSILVLTRKDIENIKRKWRNIKNDPTTFGTLVFISLLNDAPETAKKMSANQGKLSNGVMVYDEMTVTNARKLAEFFNETIKNIDVPEYVTTIAHNKGIKQSMCKPRLGKEDYQALHDAILKTITTYYKMDNTPETISSLRKIFWIIAGIIEDSGHWNDFGNRLHTIGST